MKKKTTIFRQLMLNIMIPVVIAILIFSFVSYRYNKAELDNYYRTEREIIVDEVKSLLSFYDFAMKAHEKNYSSRMREVSNFLVHQVFGNSDRLDTFNLYSASAKAGMDTSTEFIYIINSDCKIENTTFLKDKGLDFAKMDTAYVSFFKKVWRENVFVEDRFGHEIATEKIKKYAYQPSLNGNAIVELGFYSQTAIDMKNLLEEKVSGIADKFSEIKELKLTVGVENLLSPDIRKDHFPVYNECIKSKTNKRVTESTDTGTIYYDYIYLDILGASMYSGYVIKIVSDDSKERELFYREIRKFGIIFLCTILPLFLIVYFRARQITRPIKGLTEKTDQIRRGDLSIRTQPEGRNEITSLSENFNEMVHQLQESYNNLEQKVVERTHELQEQKELVEEKNKEVLDSIRYAKRIQEAILPPDSFVKSFLPDSFVLYKPKDIIAGDFYWMEHHKSGLILIAACDCTGHGVPGAMVSVVANNALNRAVREFGLTDPAKILDKVNELVEETFAKSESEVKDGMDVSLCCIDAKNATCTWSGANNPLWIFRNSENRNASVICEEFKPDKQPIGKYDSRKPFTSHTISLEKGDTLYLFSDGFADQFGGPAGKKFKYSQFRELLLQIQNLKMEEQMHKINSEFENWRGQLEQIDDVCVIGIRI